MTAKVRFIRDPRFERDILGVSNSINPLGTILRRTTDRIASQARRLARVDAQHWETQRKALRDEHGHTGREHYLQAKAKAWALKRHAKMIGAVMTHDDDDSVIGQVVAHYPGSAAIEFGGHDPHVTIGYTGVPVQYTAHAHLRRALDLGGA